MKKFWKNFAKLTMSLAAVAVMTLGIGMQADAAADYLNPYDKADYEITSPDFALTVDGQTVDVVTYFKGRGGEFAYAHLAYEGTASFEIKSLGGDMGTINLSPHSYGIDYTLTGDTLTFDLEQKDSRYVILQTSVGGKNKLMIIAADPKEDYDRFLAEGVNVVNVTEAPYNADNTYTEYASAAIQQAIDDVSAAGGGTVYVPAGVYKIVYLDGKDNVTLYLDEGAFLRGSGITEDYTWNETGDNGRQGRRVIDIKTSENFSLVGRGVVDGNLIALVHDKTGNGIDGWDDFRTGIIDGNGAKNFYMDGVTLKDSTGWTVHVQNTKVVTVKNVKLLADYQFIHTDGYDFTNCQDLHLTDCLGVCGDDIYCPKAQTKKEDGGLDMIDYLMENSVAFAHGGAGCKIGMQARVLTENIVFKNIDVVQGYRGFTIAHDDGNGDFKDIVFEGIRLEKQNTHTGSSGQFRSAPFVLWTMSKNNVDSVVDGVLVKDCSFETFNPRYMCVIQGSGANSWVKNVTLENVTFAGVKLTEANYTDYVLHGSNIENIKYDEEPNVKTDSYEAEDAVLTAGTTINNKSWASGGKTVGNVGLINADTPDESVESVTFTVTSDVAAKNELTIFYAVKGTRYVYVTVNGGAPKKVECVGDNGNNGWNILKSVSTEVNLVAGENTIVLSNPEAATPNLDRITITHTHTQEEGWSIDENNHWKVYTCGHNYTTAAEAHADADGNMLCDVCSYDMEVPSAEDILIDVYEAEDAANEGTQISNKNTASGGKAVYNVGLMNGGNVTSVTFTVSSEEATTRNMTIFYAVNGTRTFYVTVNNGVPQEVICQGGSWDNFTSTTVPVVLQAGENTIKFSNPNAAAPNLDKIEISHVHKYNKKWESDATSHWRTAYCGHDDIKKDLAGHYNADGDNKCDVCGYEIGDVEIPLPGPSGDERTTYEAENAVHSDTTLAPTAKNWASGGYIKGNVGLMDAGTVNSLTFTVPSDVAGKHTLTLRYASKDKDGVARQTTFIVNGTEVATLDCSGNGWDNPKEISLEVDLVAGNNTIVLTNETAAAPNMDCIYIVHTHAYAEEWSANADIHWHAATCGHDYKADAALHVDEDGNDICDVCEYNMGEVEPPVSGGDAEPPVSGGDAEPPVSGGDAEPPVSGGDAEPPVSGGDAEPTPAPTEEPTAAPTEAPTAAPTEAPTAAPTEAPTAAPTAAPGTPDADDNKPAPTAAPTEEPKATSPKTYDDSEIEDAVIGIGAETALDAVNASNNMLWILAVVLMGALVTAIAVCGHAYLKKEDGEDL